MLRNSRVFANKLLTANKKIKILFYHAGPAQWINDAVLVFKTYIDLLYPDLAEQLEWVLPIQQEISDDELINHIKETGADILCTSHYIWNHDFLINQLSRIKPLSKIQTIIAGGPSIDVNVNEQFFDQYPYIDYAVYGAGEQAFADIMNHLVFATPLIAFNTSNCAWKNNKTGKINVADYKFVKMSETSPFLHNKTMFADMIKEIQIKESQLEEVWLPYTLTRGCPYSCTFCDWNSGLGNKVSRRKKTYQQEIDLFQQLGIKKIFLADANVGQYDEDVSMVEYFAEKNIKESAGFQLAANFSKLKKENNLKMFHTMAQSGLAEQSLIFAIQDINQEVLNNIDRPDVGWDVHLAMIQELTTSYPHLSIRTQLICGLPGQTPESWQHTMRQILAINNVLPWIYLNEPLPASPAMTDPEYQRRFQFEYDKVSRIDFRQKYFVAIIPKKCISFSQHDFVKMTVLSVLCYAISLINLTMIRYTKSAVNTELLIDNILSSTGYDILCKNLYTNWTDKTNFYFTQNFAGVDTQSYSADSQDLTILLKDTAFMEQIQNTLPTQQKSSLIFLYQTKLLQKHVQSLVNYT